MTRRAIQDFDPTAILANMAALVVPWERLTKAEQLDRCASTISAFAGEVRDSIANAYFDSDGIFTNEDVATLDTVAEWVRFYADLEAWQSKPANQRKEKVAQAYIKRDQPVPQVVREQLASKPGSPTNPPPVKDKPQMMPEGCPRLPTPDGGMVGWEDLFHEFHANRLRMREERRNA